MSWYKEGRGLLTVTVNRDSIHFTVENKWFEIDMWHFNVGIVPYLNLSLHGDTEESKEVHDKDRPEHRDVEQLKECTREGDYRCLCSGVPELKLW